MSCITCKNKICRTGNDCLGGAGLASSLEQELKSAGLYPVMIQFTTGGVMEKDIDPVKTNNNVYK